ncbi:MAG: hypothetical protein ACTSPG_08185 [Candidatus Hodarchaeales archaeon]
MYAIIDTLKHDYPYITSSELFINFTLALHLLSDLSPWYDLDIPFNPLSIPEVISSYPYSFDWIIPSWSFITFDIRSIPGSSVVRVSFDSTTPYDSFGYSANFYLSLVEYNDTCIKLDSWLMDPYTCDGGFLMTLDPSFNNRLLFIHSLAGVLGGPLPASYIPSVNGSFVLSTYDSNKAFFFPGFITVNTSKYVFASSVRHYSDPYHEFTDINTPIAKWRLFEYSDSDSYSPTGLTGDLVFSLSGWSLDRVLPLDTGEYFFEFEFFDGSSTYTFHSKTFIVGTSPDSKSGFLPHFLLSLNLVLTLLVILFTLRFIKKRSTSITPHLSHKRTYNNITSDDDHIKTTSPDAFSVRQPPKFRRRRNY